LANIDYYLKINQLPPLKRLRKAGVSLAVAEEFLPALCSLLSSFRVKDLLLKPEERINLIMKILVGQRSYITIEALADRLGVSKGTVLNDLGKLRARIKEMSFRIKSHSRYGIKLVGDEDAIREFVLDLYMEVVDESCIYDVTDYHNASISNQYYQTRSFKDTQLIYTLVRRLEDALKKKFADRAFLLIISSLELSIDRIRCGRIVSMNPLKLESLIGTREFKEIYNSAEALGEELDIKFPVEEICYLTAQLLGCNVANASWLDSAENYAEIQIIVANLIRLVGDYLKVDFSSDLSLYKDLVYHIRPTIYRMRNKIPQKNPLLEEIKENYAQVFNAVKGNITIIEEMANAEMSEDEIGYITIHFASFIEKQKHTGELRPNVLIVCNSGIGTSNLLSARLASMYEVNIIATVAFHEYEQVIAENNIDYIISTIDLAHDSLRVIKVNPLIGNKDISTLDQIFQRKYNNIIDFERLLAIIKRHCVVGNEQQLYAEMHMEFSQIVSHKKGRGYKKMLKEVVDDRMIELDFPAADWEEAVRQAGKLLLNADCIEEKYIDEMVSVVKTMGSYIVIGKGIALPHSRSGDGAHKVGISILRLAKPVCFGHPDNDPVDLVFGLSSIDNESHLRALSDLAKMLSDEEKVEYLRKAKCTQEVMALIQQH
jgi:mannitol operon transcriptional antiterminator